MLSRLLKFTIALVLAAPLLFGGGMFALAATAPFLPGDALFPLQRTAEQVWVAITPEGEKRAQLLVNLAVRRLSNLQARAGTEHELVALAYLDAATDEAVLAAAAAPAESFNQLRARIVKLTDGTLAILDLLTVIPDTHPEVYENARARAQAIQLAFIAPGQAGEDISDPAIMNPGLPAEAVGAAGGTGSPHPVPFPPNSTAAAHAFFPLTGQHAALACSDCHPNSTYSGTPDQCADCHASAKPAAHFDGDCATCHSTAAWKPANVDHTNLAECVSCHVKDKPVNHFQGQCSLCHSTAAWKPASFDHSMLGGADCSQCHAGNAPANHWGAPCASCHRDTANWQNASFDHSVIGNTDCSQCHAGRAPANHWGAPCASCHRDTTNWRNASFDHSAIGGADCSQCHGGRAPANHYGTPCRNCHGDTANWRNASFSHPWFDIHHEGTNGACANCHPGNNYAATDCATCHDANEGGDGDGGGEDGDD